MRGQVNGNAEAIVTLRLHGNKGPGKSIKAIVDTGYNGALTLPASIIRSLGLSRVTRGTASLADGSEISFDIYAGIVMWNGRKVIIDIDEADTAPLIGMELLDGSELNIQVKPRGKVTIRPLLP